ncbi:hypothetical protein ACHAW5_008401 [Stephanodiscus triporus]|uniref:Uncharacterized protein n=1 Tax=Stephanodiscus triporus TaxID=2934178 RepID=A0ABD3QFT9_9STRA
MGGMILPLGRALSYVESRSPTMDVDLARTVGREVAKMDVNLHFSPSVYGYRPKVTSGMRGAFGGTTSQMMRKQEQVLTRVDIPFKANQGLFHEL